MPNNGYYSYGENKGRGKWFVAIFVLLLVLFAFWAYRYFWIESDIRPVKKQEKAFIKQLEKNTAYVKAHNLFSIAGTPVVEYMRQRLLYHSIQNPDSAEDSFSDEILRKFPGEKGRNLRELLGLYILYTAKVRKIDNDESLDAYQKVLRKESIPAEVFGKDLAGKLFPPSDYDTINKFFRYSEHYLKQNYSQNTYVKRNHIQRARREIYQERFTVLKEKEPIDELYRLELRIMQREMSIMSRREKQQKMQEIKDRLRKEI
ncbi:MAG: hypothetical protein AAF518_13645 [Spirochaetota bacterium]